MKTAAAAAVQQAYLDAFFELEGDLPGREAAQNYLTGSTAYYHDRLISYGFIPKLYDMPKLLHLDKIAQTTCVILDKVVDRYLVDADYRQLFGFSPLLEQLILLPTGYDQKIPIQRLDLFLDEESGDFRFCEFNTDGTSAMNEDRETTNALSRTACYQSLKEQHRVERQELFENWIDAFLDIYQASKQAVENPQIAIVDYLASATMYEFEEFRRRFERRGYRCMVCAVDSLRFEDGVLLGTDIDPSRAAREGLTRIDAVYRRAVTSELMDELEASECVLPVSGSTDNVDIPRGARALVAAVETLSICMIGGFRTQIAHCKQLFSILHLPQSLNFMTKEQQEFIRAHIPYTSPLSSLHIDIEAVIANRDQWIIKPRDGYASKGVYAGVDHSDDQWREQVLQHSDDNYIIQTYCQQYPMLNTRPFPVDGEYQPLYTSAEAAQADTSFEPLRLEPWNLLTGLYVYDGRFSGIFDRAGQSGLIVGFQGGITIGSLLIDYDAKAGLALRTRDTDDS